MPKLREESHAAIAMTLARVIVEANNMREASWEPGASTWNGRYALSAGECAAAVVGPDSPLLSIILFAIYSGEMVDVARDILARPDLAPA